MKPPRAPAQGLLPVSQDGGTRRSILAKVSEKETARVQSGLGLMGLGRQQVSHNILGKPSRQAKYNKLAIISILKIGKLSKDLVCLSQNYGFFNLLGE